MNQVYSRWLSRMISMLLLLTLLVHTRPAAAATISVGCGDTRVAELIAAIEQANTTPVADTIELAANCVYTLTAIHNTTEGPTGLPVISTPLTINGNRASIERSTAADTPAFRFFFMPAAGTLTLRDVTLRNGATSDFNRGGAIYNNGGTLTLIESTLRNNTAKNGGGIYNRAGEITIQQSTLSHNSASYGAAIQNGATWSGTTNSDHLTVTHSTFSKNTAQEEGGAIWSFDPITVTHSIFSANNAFQDGGAMYLYDGSTIDQSTFYSNTASGGGAIFIYGDTEPVFITNSTFSQNSASVGAGIWNHAPLTIQHSTFSGNTAYHFGGAITNYGMLNLHHSTISNNTSELYGGGIYNAGGSCCETRLVTHSTISTNSAVYGGGIYNTGNDLGAADNRPMYNGEYDNDIFIQQTTISGNTATQQGGGIWNDDVLTLEASTVTANSATDGGGIWNAVLIEMQNSTISGNRATNQGGGIWNALRLEIQNSTISGNRATNQGGGIWSDFVLMLEASTITRNQAADGGGVWHRDELMLAQTIVAANTAATGAADIAFTGVELITEGHNFIGSNATIESVFPAGTPNSNGEYVGTPAAPLAPRLGRLSDNGGPTWTHLPVHGSPVIDTGALTSTFTTDQRGFTRIYGPRVDIGAVEASPSAFLHPTHVIEGSPAVFTVRLAMPLTQTVTIDYATSDGTAQAPQDYTATSGTVTFAPGTTEAVVLVPVPADAIAEASETFTLTLSSPNGVLLGTSSATATIVEAQARLYLPLVRTPAPTQQRTGQ